MNEWAADELDIECYWLSYTVFSVVSPRLFMHGSLADLHRALKLYFSHQFLMVAEQQLDKRFGRSC